MRIITRDELKQRLDSHWDGVLVEVLSEDYFREFHLPGALHVAFDEHFAENFERLMPDRDREVVVYCLVRECTASAEAGRRLEELGYTNVFDYEEGKNDWRDAGLPIEHVHAETHG